MIFTLLKLHKADICANSAGKMIACSFQVILGVCKFIIQLDMSYVYHKSSEDSKCVKIFWL